MVDLIYLAIMAVFMLALRGLVNLCAKSKGQA